MAARSVLIDEKQMIRNQPCQNLDVTLISG